MKVIIVDDNENKIKSISLELENLSIKGLEIYRALNAAEARHLLSRQSFDLLLLDLILPTRSGSTPSADTGLDLLRQIVEDCEIPSPRNIVGITADHQALKLYEQDFRKLTTQILLVDPALQDWKLSLRYLINSIISSEDSKNNYSTDVCFVTALRDPELLAVLSLPIEWSPEESLGNGILYQRGSYNVGGSKLSFVCAHSNQMGPIAAAFTSRIIIEKFKPKYLIMTGICGGIGSNLELGDVVIAEKSWDWQCGKWLHDGSFEASPDQKEASPELVALARGLSDTIVNFHMNYSGNRPKSLPKAMVGPMVSGSAVVESSELHARFKMQHRKAIAVDMECYGIYYSSYMSPSPTPKYICIKSVSDLADKDKADNIQRYCSDLSAYIALGLVERLFA